MALKTFVKISGVNNLSDARYCAGMGVDQLGFNVVPDHSNFIDSQKFKEIAGWVAGVKFVGETEARNADYVEEVINSYKFDSIQTTRPDLLEEFRELHTSIILDLNVDEYADASSLEKVLSYAHRWVDYVLIHSQHERETRQRLKEIIPFAKRYDLVLGSWITSQNINELLNTTEFMGIALRGGEEIKPGYKDFDELGDVLEVIEVEEGG